MYSKPQQRAFFEQSKALLAQKEMAENVAAEPAKGLIADLRDVIVYHEWKYYIQNDPVISDFEYDQLFKFLEALEARFPEWVAPDSPTQRVSADLTSDFPSVEHLTPMLSLANSYNEADLVDFDEQIKRFLDIEMEEDIEYVVEPKYDGGSIALVYENDLLTRAATRGNGVLGEEMTKNARVMNTIPLRAAFSEKGIHKVEVRGEVLIRKDRFDKINEARQAAGQSLFANPRNAATGGLRMKDPKEAAKRGLEAFIYQIGYAANEAGEDVQALLKTHDESIELLGQIGFKVPQEERKVCKNIKDTVEILPGLARETR